MTVWECQIFCVNNVFIGLRPDSEFQRLSPNEFDRGHFMFGEMLDLATMPATSSTSTIWRRVNTYLLPNMANCYNDFITPPQEMQDFAVDAAIQRHIFVGARQITTTIGGVIRPYTYFFYSYIGNLLYRLEFVVERTSDNLIFADPLHGRLIIGIEAILPGQAYPPDGVSTWIQLQREDALIRDGGVM